MTLEDLLALEGIRQMQARYVDAVFRKDYDAFCDCWTEDSQWRIAGQVLHGRAEIRAFLERAMSNFHRVIMTFRTPIIERRDDEVLSRVQVTEQNGFKNGRPGSTIGTYFERVVPGNDDLWRRRWALFQLHYMGPSDLTGSYFDQIDYGAPPAFPPEDATVQNHAGIGQPVNAK